MTHNMVLNINSYPEYHFVSFSVHDIRRSIELSIDETVSDYSVLCNMTDELLNEVLHHCWRKQLIFWEADGSLDLDELERLANTYLQNIGK